jgi:hypothetical protein
MFVTWTQYALLHVDLGAIAKASIVVVVALSSAGCRSQLCAASPRSRA